MVRQFVSVFVVALTRSPSVPALLQTRHVSRLTLSRQLLLLQMCIVVLVVATVAGVSAVQTDQAFRRDESRRMLGTAESVAAEAVIRLAAEKLADGPSVDSGLQEIATDRLERARVSAGASYVVLVDADRDVLTALPPVDEDVAIRADVRLGASWRGTTERYGRKAIEAQVPIFSADPKTAGDILGYVVIGRFYPSRLEVLGTAAPSAFIYLVLAGAIGVAGSLLLARRVKRQTLGLEPREIAALVEQREAMLHGVREGVLGVDLTGVVAFANDEAMELLELEQPVLGRDVGELVPQAEVAAILRGELSEQDIAVAIGARLLVLNAQPVHVRGKQTGWVTSMRDRTELLGLQHELAEAQAGTDTLRAQVHEFRNRLHAISGMAELGQVTELSSFVQAVIGNLDARVLHVSGRLDDPAVAALVVAKASRADELGIDFALAEGAELAQHDPELSADVVTVIGNLLDNAFDAAGPAGRVVLDVSDDGERISVEVRDSGGGIAEEHLSRIFEVGFTTKDGEDVKAHGFGLALTRMACARHHGSVSVSNGGGAVLRAELFVGAGDG